MTSDSVVVRPLENAPEDLARLVTVDPRPRIPRDRLDYDVVLDVPRLCIEQLRLRVDSLTARVSIDADIASLVRITAGAGVAVGHVDLYLEGVRATALLAVDLTDVKRAVDVVMTYLDAHPDVLKRIWRERIVSATRRK